MLVRYFAAACSAAGVEEERHDLAAGVMLSELLTAVLAIDRPDPPAELLRSQGSSPGAASFTTKLLYGTSV